MGYEATFEGRIELDPPMEAGVWRRLLDEHPTYGALDKSVRKILPPMIMPVSSGDGSKVVAVEPGQDGCAPSAMPLALRHFVYVAALFSEEEGRFCRFSGGFDGWGENGERYRLTVGDTDPITSEVFDASDA